MASQDPRFGLYSQWAYDDSTWAGENDANLLKIARFGLHLSVKSRTTTAAPGVVVDGDTYIVPVGATGAWSALAVGTVVCGTPAGTWAIGVPRVGWVAFVEDEDKLSVYKSGGWSAGITI